MSNESQWWTAPTQSEDGRLIMVTGRKNVDAFRSNPKFSIRIEVSWKYDALDDGMPDFETSTLMEKVQDALTKEFDKDPIAVLTGIYTGDSQRDWIFYTLSTRIFEKKINQALSDFPVLPITIYSENDPDWNEYAEMCEAEINID